MDKNSEIAEKKFLSNLINRDSVFRLFNSLYGTLTHVTLENLEAVPQKGPLILAMNHVSRIDLPLLCATDYRLDWKAFVADKYKSWILFNTICDNTGMIWIDRSAADFGAFKKAFDWLKNGGMLVLAPEGTRSRNAQLLEAKSGIVMLAAKSGVPVCTGSVWGTEHFMKDYLHFRKPRITLRFSPPVVLPKIDPENREESLRKSTDEVMCRIAAMLPEKYRGFYKNYPRIQELLAEWKLNPSLQIPVS